MIGCSSIELHQRHVTRQFNEVNLLSRVSEIPKDEEFLEAVISAMRSLLQMIASKNISQVQKALVFPLRDFF